jgi:hypothetical protein
MNFWNSKLDKNQERIIKIDRSGIFFAILRYGELVDYCKVFFWKKKEDCIEVIAHK